MVIENSELSNVSRMHYLCSCLKDEARDALRSLPVTEANFKVAWDLLIARYDNKRRLVHEHIHALTTLPCVNSESAQDLAALRDKAKMSIQSLENLGCPVGKWDDLLVYLLVQKLDKSTRKAWELQLGNTREYPSYDTLDTFLAARIRAFENILPITNSKAKKPSKSSVPSHALNASETQCPICKQNHFLSACPDFQNKAVQQRRDLVTKFRRCMNCLSARHQKAVCPSKHNCPQCQQRRHTMLHEIKAAVTDDKRTQDTEPESPAEHKVSSQLLSKTNYNKSGILLATARIQVRSSSGRGEIIRALLDQGSVTSLVTENLAQRLRLPRVCVAVSITGIGETESAARHAANITVSSHSGTGPSYTTAALILSSLTKYAPPQSRDTPSLDHLRDLKWADNLPSDSDPIEMIIGADLYGSVLLPGLRSGLLGRPTAQNSIFGWIISGPLSQKASPRASIVSINHATLTSGLENKLRRFWEVEEFPQQSYLTPEEQRCEEHFRATHHRNPNGQYVVRLPFKTNPPLNIGASRNSALLFMSRLEMRLQNQPALASEYREFLQEYEDLGHMEKVDPHVSPHQTVYIPHHAVIREHSSTTRLRVVFNASHPSSNGSSLNDHLMVGPKLQTDLRSVILRWRQFRYVYTADIAKMYRQILVDPRDVDYQRILWRPSTSTQMQDYRLITVTYGTACAPYLALCTIQQLGQDEGTQFPLALPVLRNHIYVDDCIFGADDRPLAKHIRNQLVSLLAKGGFQLRKWASNCSSLLSNLDASDHGLAQCKTLQTDESLKVLGVTWIPTTDAFHFSIEMAAIVPRTKRTILSTIAKLFDLMGWLTPVIVTSKILMQQLWATKSSWDEQIPAPIMQKWLTYHEQLPLLREVSLPRWTEFGTDTNYCELHGFADASLAAYAAVIYLKIVSLSGSSTVSLLMSKSKVAPLKTLTIPRLELSATVLLARTMSFVRSTLELTSSVPLLDGFDGHARVASSISISMENLPRASDQ